ncbi:Sh3 domain-containing ring finger protein 3 [Plakobranchus ocellatus]|uniref:Sh3 domain-containing ring finger protein 3 n=1 Tax=Plakobranchus ocellatus TaxID=259542 RepID=A0AAV4AP94_9GAST|nr:Sh3 domain-containing ring finger protein 3 [Plakobranchus ocellatus]
MHMIWKEKKDREKKVLVKLFGGKGKKNKQTAQVEPPADHKSPMAVLCFDDVTHVRSGSYPAETSLKTGDTVSLLSSSHHRKAASFDAVNTSTPPVPAKPRPKPVFRERYCCVVPYPPQTDRELSLELGDIIHVHRKSEDGWYKGTQERTGKTGMFPASFVEKL